MVRLRIAKPSDGAACTDIYRPIVEQTAISFETTAPTAEEMARRIEGTLPRLPWLVAAEGTAILGYAYASPHRERPAYRWSVDVTAYVAESSRRSGVGRRLYAALTSILERQGFRSAFAGIALPNDASIGLHEAIGFAPLGVYQEVGYKLGAWRSVGWWRLALSDVEDVPAEPIPFSRLLQVANIQDLLS